METNGEKKWNSFLKCAGVEFYHFLFHLRNDDSVRRWRRCVEKVMTYEFCKRVPNDIQLFHAWICIFFSMTIRCDMNVLCIRWFEHGIFFLSFRSILDVSVRIISIYWLKLQNTRSWCVQWIYIEKVNAIRMYLEWNIWWGRYRNNITVQRQRLQ